MNENDIKIELVRPGFQIVYDHEGNFLGVVVKSDKFPWRKMFFAFPVGRFYFGMSIYEAVHAYLASRGDDNV